LLLAGVGWSWGKGVALTPPKYLGWNKTRRTERIEQIQTVFSSEIRIEEAGKPENAEEIEELGACVV
jgi:hypothetical protein